MIPSFKNVHPNFSLNGDFFDRETLKELAHKYIKEGKPYEQVTGNFLIDWLDEKMYVEAQTSGSTGTPKTIRLSKQAMVHSALATADFFQIKPGNSALHCLPSSFIAGKMMLVRAMVLGWELDIIPPTSNPLKGNKKHYDFCAMVPLQVEQSLEHLTYINTLIIGGAPASKQLISDLQTVKTKAYATYGMTETITHIAVKPLNHILKDERVNYQVLPNITVATDDRSCLVIKAPRITEESIITNDVVTIISESEFEWLGRFDNVINSGGIKLHPEQIEEKLSTLISNRLFVAGIEDAHLGSKLILVIEDAKNILQKEAVIECIKQSQKFEKFEIPKAIYFTTQFVATTSGKIQRSKTLKDIGII